VRVAALLLQDIISLRLASLEFVVLGRTDALEFENKMKKVGPVSRGFDSFHRRSQEVQLRLLIVGSHPKRLHFSTVYIYIYRVSVSLIDSDVVVGITSIPLPLRGTLSQACPMAFC
jgi:hypothetical protein